MKTAIVIPTYNESGNIERLIRAISNLNIAGLEMIIVDDNSPDGTGDLAERMAEHHPVFVLKRAGKLGIGSAYIDGFTTALSRGADLIFEMDADFSHDPDDIPRLIAETAHADLVIGSRKINGGKVIGWGFTRKFMSNGAMWLSRLLLNLKARDVTAGFRCFKRTVLETIALRDIKSNGYAFQEELLYRTQLAGFTISEIPVTFIDRQEGKSKLSKKDIVEFFVTMVRLRKESERSLKGLKS